MKQLLSSIAILLGFIAQSQTINSVTTSPNPLECQSWIIDVAGDKPMPQYFVTSETYAVNGSVLTVTITWDAPPFGNPMIQPYLQTVTIPAQAIPAGNYTLVVENFFVLTGQVTATNTTSNFAIGSCCPAVADFSMNATELCWDDTLQITDNSPGVGTIEWHVNGTLYQSGPGSFELHGYTGAVNITQYAIDSACADTVTQTAYFSARPTTDFNLNVSGPLHTVTASGSSAFSYTWDFGDGTTATGALASHSYATGGTYDICLTATDDFGCVADSCIQVVWSPVGLNEEEVSIVVYPNPARDRVVVSGVSDEIVWYNLQGQIIEVPEVRGTNSSEFNVGHLDRGMYILRTKDKAIRVAIE